jgi:1-acyl-sn-glycerol-3-phosphate acyltransferase
MPLLRVLLRVRVTGPRVRRRGGGLIVAANHQSWIDAYMVQYALYPHRVTFLMTEAFRDLPFARFYFRAAGTSPIRERGPSVAGLRAAHAALGRGGIVCLFPEGQLSTTGAVGRGRPGVARLARRTGAPVLPLGIRGAIRVFSKVQKRPRRHTVEIRLGEPLPYEGGDGRDAEQGFTERVMERIRGLACG